MSKALRTCLIWGLLLGLSSPAMAKQTAKMEGKPDLKITLRVYDYAGLDAGLLRRALDSAEIILRDAGVTVAPVLCTQHGAPQGCSEAPGGLNIALRIVPKLVPGVGYADDDTLGLVAGHLITVNYSRAQQLADQSHIVRYKILGYVVAHELGHVLLGPNSHSAEGVMAAYIGDKELRLIRVMLIGFLPFQKARIRAYMLAQTHELGADAIALAQR